MALHADLVGHSGAVLALCAILATVVWIVNVIINDPLKSVGGAWSARWVSIKSRLLVLRGRQTYYIHKLHEQQGTLVRSGPNEISTTDLTAVKTIYKVGSAFVKTRWYTDFTGLLRSKETSLFNTRDPKQHAHHRRIQAFNFSEKWLKLLEPDVRRNVDMAMTGMQREYKSQGHFDAFKWFTFMATDVVGDAAFGESFRLLESGQKNQYVDDLEQVASRGILGAAFPYLVNRLLSRLPFGFVAKAGECQRRVVEYGAQSIDRYQKHWQADKHSVKPTLLTNEYKLVEEGTLTQAQITRDGTGYIIAGTDTTATTATYILWHLANHPNIQSQVIQAVQTLPENCTDEDIQPIDLFQHIINETLRLDGPASASLPRVVPEGGFTIAGHFIPGGTQVSTQSYSLHRNPEVWSEPLKFDPSRWQNTTKEMRDSFMPFGGGSRVCIGMHFALIELRHAIVSFYRTFPRGVAPAYIDGFEAQDMKQNIYFLAQPVGKRCLLRPL